MGALKDIADFVSDKVLPGIDWEALEAKWGMPREELVYHVTSPVNGEAPAGGFFDYVDQIVAAQKRAEGQLAKIQLSFQVEDDPATEANEVALSMESYAAARDGVSGIQQQLRRALEGGIATLASGRELQMPLEAYRGFLTYFYVASLYGAVAHAQGLLQLQDVAPEDIVASADDICRAFQAIAQLGEVGGLSVLEPPAVGVVQVGVIVGVVVVSVAVASLIAWAVVSVVDITGRNKLVAQACADAAASGDPKRLEHCEKLSKINAEVAKSQPNPFSALQTTVLMIGGVYLLFMVAPHVLKAFKQSKSQKKSTVTVEYGG